MLEGVQNHLRTTIQRSLAVFRFKEILKLINMLGPDLCGPETTVVIKVFPDVTNDVCLLQKETHGLVQIRALEQGRVSKLRFHKEACQTVTNQTSNVIAVEVICLNRLHGGISRLGFATVVGHPVAHLLCDVPDNGLVSRLQLLELSNDIIELNQQFTVFLLRSIPIEGPAVFLKEILEISEEGLLCLQRDGSIILNGVQAPKSQIENANGNEQFRMQFFDDSTETSTRQVEKLKAFLQRF